MTFINWIIFNSPAVLHEGQRIFATKIAFKNPDFSSFGTAGKVGKGKG